MDELLVNSLSYAYASGKLSITQRRGVTKLIPKKDTELYYVKNWRPISLLNCDYKIAAKVIANRIKQVLANLISNDQTGFIKGRFIVRRTLVWWTVLNHASEKKIPGSLLFLDFQKAFDNLEWSFIRKALSHYGFGPSIMSWFDTLYHETESCVTNNGWSSMFFKLERGVRQECPLSPYLFILVVELLVTAIRKNKKNNGNYNQ